MTDKFLNKKRNKMTNLCYNKNRKSTGAKEVEMKKKSQDFFVLSLGLMFLLCSCGGRVPLAGLNTKDFEPSGSAIQKSDYTMAKTTSKANVSYKDVDSELIDVNETPFKKSYERSFYGTIDPDGKDKEKNRVSPCCPSRPCPKRDLPHEKPKSQIILPPKSTPTPPAG